MPTPTLEVEAQTGPWAWPVNQSPFVAHPLSSVNAYETSHFDDFPGARHSSAIHVSQLREELGQVEEADEAPVRPPAHLNSAFQAAEATTNYGEATIHKSVRAMTDETHEIELIDRRPDIFRSDLSVTQEEAALHPAARLFGGVVGTAVGLELITAAAAAIDAKLYDKPTWPTIFKWCGTVACTESIPVVSVGAAAVAWVLWGLHLDRKAEKEATEEALFGYKQLQALAQTENTPPATKELTTLAA